MPEIYRLGKQNKYAQVHRNMLYDSNITAKAKGIGALLETFSIGFEISKAVLIKKSKEKEKAITRGVLELEKNNYLFRFQRRGERGYYKTCWYFNSEGVDINHLNDLIIDFQDVTLLTESKLLEKLLELNGYYIKGGTANGASQDSPMHLDNNSKLRSNIFNKKYFMFKSGKVRLHPHFTQKVKEVK